LRCFAHRRLTSPFSLPLLEEKDKTLRMRHYIYESGGYLGDGEKERIVRPQEVHRWGMC
jgi:hypothetical protein